MHTHITFLRSKQVKSCKEEKKKKAIKRQPAKRLVNRNWIGVYFFIFLTFFFKIATKGCNRNTKILISSLKNVK